MTQQVSGATPAAHRLTRVLAERVTVGSRPRERTDRHRVALAIEGGGMRGTVSAGMALAVSELGLLDAFDAVYGASAGAISAAWLISSRPQGLRGWAEPRFARTLIRKRNLLRGRPVVDVRTLVEDVYVRQFPLDYASVLASPIELHPLATHVETGRSTDLHGDLADESELRLALRASAALPLLAGGPVCVGGRRYYDAGLSESIPFRQALRDGATHVLVLRSRPPALPAPRRMTPSLGDRMVAAAAFRRVDQLRESFLARPARLADDDRLLAAYDEGFASSPATAVVSIHPADTAPRVGRLETDGDLLRSALQSGYEAARHVLCPATSNPK